MKIFAYWTGPAAIGAGFKEFWSAHVPGFQVFSDADVVPLIRKRYPESCVPYCSIRIPSCKSDVARLILLEEFGGLFIDAHTGCNNLGSLARTLSDCRNFELGVFDIIANHKKPGDRHLVNGALYARRNSSCIKALTTKVLSNLTQHYESECKNAADGTYNIASLTGAWNIRTLFFEINRQNDHIVLQERFRKRVRVMPLGNDETSPLQFYRYYQYRSPSNHWSERQKEEPLFDIVAGSAAASGTLSYSESEINKLIVRADELNREGRYGATLGLLTPWLALAPNHHWLNFHIARAYSGVGDTASSRDHFLLAATSDYPFRVGAMFEVVRHDLAAGIFDHVGLLDDALALPGELAGKDTAAHQKRYYFFQIQFLRAMLLLRSGDISACNELLDTAYDFSLAVDERPFGYDWILELMTTVPVLPDYPNVEYLRQIFVKRDQFSSVVYDEQLNKMPDTAFVLEIGAMDGVRFDPLHPHLVKRRWNAILVEPLPDMYDLLRSNCKSYGNIRCVNVAISETSGPLSMYRIKPETAARAGVGEWVVGISSVMKGPTLSYLTEIVVEEPVRSLSFADFVEKYSIGRIDILQIDTEGYDWKIFRQIDLKRWKISVIRMGAVNLRPMDRLKVFETLGQAGYAFQYDGVDITAVRRSDQLAF